MSVAGAAIGREMSELSAYVAGALERDLPREVAERAKRHLLDTLGAMLSGSLLRPGRLAIEFVRREGGHPDAAVAGSDVVVTATNAALANGMLAHADETDDSHPHGFLHPGCGVVPAALAMAEREHRDGVALLRAIVLGYDLAARSALAVGGHRFHIERHRSAHAFGSLFGAAAAAGSLARLTPDQTRWLFAYAAQQASGLACWTRDGEHVAKAFDFGGMGARNGVAAAAMVAAGFTGVDDVLAGADNLFEAFGGEAAAFVRGLGEEYEILRTDIKRWCVGSPIQAPLDAVEALQREHGARAEDVADLEVRVSDQEAHIVDNRSIPTICLQHQVALLLVDGGLTFASSHDETRMSDPAVVALRRRIRLVPDPRLPKRQAAVILTTTAGAAVERAVEHVRGTTSNPMTDGELEKKVLDLAAQRLGERKAARLIERIGMLERVADVCSLRTLLQVHGV